MKSPLIMAAVLHYKGILTHDEAEALCQLYRQKPVFDSPVPIDLAAALDIVLGAFSESEDDAEVEAILAARSHHPSAQSPDDGVGTTALPPEPPGPPYWWLAAHRSWYDD